MATFEKRVDWLHGAQKNGGLELVPGNRPSVGKRQYMTQKHGGKKKKGGGEYWDDFR